MTKPNKQDIFNKVSSAEERRKIFDDLIKSRTEIFCKGTSNEVFKLSCERVSAENRMMCQFQKTDDFEPAIPSALICQFDLSGEKYFFKSTLDYHIKNYVLDLNTELFHLQRRQSYRINIPSSARTSAELIHSQSKESLKATPADLSTGGCRLLCKGSFPWKTSDKVHLQLKIGQRDPMQLPGVIRHIRQATPSSTGTYIGIQFEGISSAVEKELFSITMELYREFFSRLE